MLRQVNRRTVTAVHRDEGHRLSRRDFLQILFLASAALGLASLPLAGWAERAGPKPDSEPWGAPIGRVPADKPGGAEAGARIHPPVGRFVAWDRRCSHPFCPALGEPGLACPCHESPFNARTGQALLGPPRRPLPVVSAAGWDGTDL